MKNDNRKLGHGTSSHLEGNVNHSLETSTVVQKENQSISREIFEGNMQKINHNLKKIKEIQRLLKLNDTSIKFESSLKKSEVAVKQMACLTKICAEFVHREKQENYGSARLAAPMDLKLQSAENKRRTLQESF